MLDWIPVSSDTSGTISGFAGVITSLMGACIYLFLNTQMFNGKLVKKEINNLTINYANKSLHTYKIE